MARILDDGTVVPSHMQVEDRAPRFFSGDYFGDVQLHQGEVKEIIWPDDDRSRTKRFIEYNVVVQYFRQGIGTTRVYTNCVVSNGLQGLADLEYWTLRAYPSSGDGKNNQPTVKNGSKVLLLCINGQTNFPIILAGMFDPTDDTQKDSDLKNKHFYKWRFNGITFEVDDDGQLKIVYTGKSDEKGDTKVDDSVAGSFILLDKDGNVSIQDSDGKNQFLVDHKNGKIIIKRDNAFELGAATDKMLLGERFRKAQKQLHSDLQIQFATTSKLVQQASTAAISAAGKMIVPISGAMSAAVDFAQVGALFLTASQSIDKLGKAIQAFEQSNVDTDFLSPKNKID